MTTFYPVYFDLETRPCVVIGGGVVAEQKVLGLIEAGAHVTVVSEQVTPRLDELAALGRIQLTRRSYRRGDLEGMFLAIAAPDDRAVNREIWEEAEQRGIPLNAVDDLPHCTFIAPAIYRQRDLTVAISTAGKSPALAVRLRERLAALIGSEFGAFLDLLGDMREGVAARVPGFAARTALWYRIVDSDAIEFIRRGDVTGAQQRALQLVDETERKQSRTETPHPESADRPRGLEVTGHG